MTNENQNTEELANNNKASEAAQEEVVEKTEVEILNDKISGLQTVINDQNDKMLRSLAEMENLRKRSADDIEKTSKYAISKFASELVVVVENLYLAIDNMPKDEIEKSEQLKNFALGVTMTNQEMIKVFEKNGIKRLNPINEAFNHDYHEAIAHVEGEGESGIVKKVIQAGYSINNRLIRPALVEVYK